MKTSVWVVSTLAFFVIALLEGIWLFRAYSPNSSRAAVLEFDKDHPFSFHFHHPSAWERFAQDVIGDSNRISSLDQTLEKEMKLSDSSVGFGTPRKEETNKELRLIFDIKGHEKGDYSVRVKDNEVIVSGKGRESQTKITSAPWPFHKMKKEREVVREGSWNQVQMFPVPEGVDPQHFKVERRENSLAITFQKIKESHT